MSTMRPRGLLVLLFTVVLMAGFAAPATALVLPHPEKAKRLTIQGHLIGKVGKGHKVRLLMTAADPKGFIDLQSMTARLTLRGQVLQEIVYRISDSSVEITGQKPVRVGERPAPEGSFFQIFPHHARPIRQTFSVEFTLWIKFLEPVSKSATWQFLATDRANPPHSVALRSKVRLAPGFLSWGTLGIAVAVALFIGSYAGNSMTHRKYREAEPSVWDIVERRLKEQKARPPTVFALRGDGVMR
jgi:hypothetical protein